MLNPEFYRWMDALSQHPSFVAAVLISDQKEDEGFRQLVLRFILQLAFSGGDQELRKELGEYITDWVRVAAVESIDDEEQLDEWARKFRATFDLIYRALSDEGFKRFDKTKSRFLGPFSISAYEAITSGLGSNIVSWEDLGDESTELLEQRIKELWSQKKFKDNFWEQV